MNSERVPVCLDLVVCDAIHADPWTGKRTLLGLYSGFSNAEYPFTISDFTAYGTIIDCLGSFPLVLQIIPVDEPDEPLFQYRVDITCQDPLQIIELDFRVGPIVVPSPGLHILQLLFRNVAIAERRLMFEPIPEKPS